MLKFHKVFVKMGISAGQIQNTETKTLQSSSMDLIL